MTVVNSRDAGAAGGVAAVEPRVRALARSCPQLRRRQCMALLLITPLFLFLMGTFILPLSGMLKLAVDDRETALLLPRTLLALQGWDQRSLPSDAAYEALVADLRQAQMDKTVGTIARRLNYDTPGLRSLQARAEIEALIHRVLEARYAAAPDKHHLPPLLANFRAYSSAPSPSRSTSA